MRNSPPRTQPVVRVFVNFASEYGRSVLRGVIRHARETRAFEVGKAIEVPARRLPPGEALVVQAANATTLDQLARLGTSPIVNVSGVQDVCWPTVRIDDDAAGRLGAEHLLSRGLRRLGFAGFPGKAFSVRRGLAFRSRLAAEPRVTVLPRQWEPGMRVANWIPPESRPVGVLCCSDQLAVSLLRACSAEGLRVPEDVAVLGIDNDEFISELATPPLSSIAVAGERIGAEAARLALRLLEGLAVPSLIELPPTRIVTRQSTDILATADPVVARALEVLRRRFAGPLLVTEVLRGLPVNRRMLEIRFKRALGRTIHGELVRLRLERAKELLATSDLSIEHIASTCGFGESRQMGAAFRRHEGMPPSAYRAHVRAGAPRDGGGDRTAVRGRRRAGGTASSPGRTRGRR